MVGSYADSSQIVGWCKWKVKAVLEVDQCRLRSFTFSPTKLFVDKRFLETRQTKDANRTLEYLCQFFSCAKNEITTDVGKPAIMTQTMIKHTDSVFVLDAPATNPNPQQLREKPIRRNSSRITSHKVNSVTQADGSLSSGTDNEKKVVDSDDDNEGKKDKKRDLETPELSVKQLLHNQYGWNSTQLNVSDRLAKIQNTFESELILSVADLHLLSPKQMKKLNLPIGIRNLILEIQQLR